MKKIFFSLFIFLIVFFVPKILFATSGCCSHHDGVCGCSGGRQLCCDGSLSPSCTCYSPAPKPKIESKTPIKSNNTITEKELDDVCSDVTELCGISSNTDLKEKIEKQKKEIENDQKKLQELQEKFNNADTMMWLNGIFSFAFIVITFYLINIGNKFDIIKQDDSWGATKIIFFISVGVLLYIWIF